ncbi:alpha/beta fold hydrolase [Planctobacterium marinum]|uniref:Alpha/beta hydrolase n=1 Tax=Planctobacterium marinum TaxID=1631968 RepID=A0AA48HJB3_9ALTE|nr:hypothetical protein MACH26_12920 [Planctobacterium marinum]
MRNGILFILFSLLTQFSLAEPVLKISGEGAGQFQSWWWQAKQPQAETVILLSGPNDHWNSDAAWWLTLAPMLQKHTHVVAIERPVIGLNLEAPQLGYVAFAKQVKQVITEQGIDDFSIVAFASSNMTVLQLLNQYPELSPRKVILIDPDVLTEFSVSRYQADAQPFKDKQKQYQEYLQSGKYIARVQQKNAAELEHIKKLAPEFNDEQRHWLQDIFSAREKIPNQVNLFSEIAVYGEDLARAKQLGWPDELPMMIIDTDFEQGYINRNDDAQAIEGLQKWRKDAWKHYKSLTQGEHKKLISLESQEHLIMIEQPELIIKLLIKS